VTAPAPLLCLNPFVQRQTVDSPFSSFDGSWGDLLARVEAGFVAGNVRPGYRDGVCLVDLNPEGIRSGVVLLKEGDLLVGSFTPRRADEAPRKQVLAKGARKMPAVTAYAVLYRADVLAEGGDNTLPVESGGWEVISLNASPVEGDAPMDPLTLMYNHFSGEGGTATHMTDEAFVAALRAGFHWWKDKAMAGGA